MAALIGFGASAINPYMAFESIEDMLESGAIIGATGDHASDFATARVPLRWHALLHRSALRLAEGIR